MSREEEERDANYKSISDLRCQLKAALGGPRCYPLLALPWVGVVIILWVVLMSSLGHADPPNSTQHRFWLDNLDALETLSLLVVGVLMLIWGLAMRGTRTRRIYEVLHYYHDRDEELEERSRKARQQAGKGKGCEEGHAA
jgi:hypothetical protein